MEVLGGGTKILCPLFLSRHGGTIRRVRQLAEQVPQSRSPKGGGMRLAEMRIVLLLNSF